MSTSILPTLFFETSSLAEPGAHWLMNTGWSASPFILLSLPHFGDCKVHHSICGCWESVLSGKHVIGWAIPPPPPLCCVSQVDDCCLTQQLFLIELASAQRSKNWYSLSFLRQPWAEDTRKAGCCYFQTSSFIPRVLTICTCLHYVHTNLRRGLVSKTQFPCKAGNKTVS